MTHEQGEAVPKVESKTKPLGTNGRSASSQTARDKRRTISPPIVCDFIPVGKQRNGTTRYWCKTHGAGVAISNGQLESRCRNAHIRPIADGDAFPLRLGDYAGGVALWGAVAPVYDTTEQALELGIHVHARRDQNGRKVVDRTYRAVRLFAEGLPASGFVVTELDGIYFMVSSVFGYETKAVKCTHCGALHLDRDWFSVHPHQKHLCAACGKFFRDSDVGIGNPVSFVRSALGIPPRPPRPAGRTIEIHQSEFIGGVQIWGSNPAFVWTGDRQEEEGIHVHAFRSKGDRRPEIDNTYSAVTIDGVQLDATMIRVAMALSALPHLKGRVVSTNCPACETPGSCRGKSRYTASREHRCQACGLEFVSAGRMRRTILNPLPEVLKGLAARAVRPPQQHDMALVREAPTL